MFLSIHRSVCFRNSILKSIKQPITEQMSAYPCRKCKVVQNGEAILCKLCNKWNHINCVQVNSMNYEKLKSDPTLCYCPQFKVNLILLILSNQIPVNKILSFVIFLSFCQIFCIIPLFLYLFHVSQLSNPQTLR